jgi:hypothetical protein
VLAWRLSPERAEAEHGQRDRNRDEPDDDERRSERWLHCPRIKARDEEQEERGKERAMADYPQHKSAAFAEWVESGMPEEAELEEGHGRHRFTSGGFLMGFLGCTDAVPEHLRSSSRGSRASRGSGSRRTRSRRTTCSSFAARAMRASGRSTVSRSR